MTVSTVAGQAPALATTDPTANVLDWGFQYYGYLIDGQTGCSSCDWTSTPWDSPSGEKYVTQISAQSGILALHADGSVTAWGRNDEGQLGDDGTAYDVLSPVHVYLPAVVAISAGGDAFGIALTGAGQVYSWGNNTYGDLGRSSSGSDDPAPAEVNSALPSDIVSISAGADHSLALTEDGYVWAWGSNQYGQVGNNGGTGWQTPSELTSLSGVVSLAGANDSSFAVESNGSAYAWGANWFGQLGDGSSLATAWPRERA